LTFQLQLPNSKYVALLIIRQGLKFVCVGIGIGLAGALVSSRFLTNLLFEVKPGDLLTLAAVAVALVLVALLACWLPARRATRVDPMEALRYE